MSSFSTGKVPDQLEGEDRAASLLPARYEHRGENSVFLGQYRECDLYYDAQGGLPTVIARTGAGADYVSGLVFAQHLPALAMARRLAEAKGLLSRQFVLDGKAIDAVTIALNRRITERLRAKAATLDDDTEQKIAREVDYLRALEEQLRNTAGTAVEHLAAVLPA